jgi:cell division protein FtsA
LKKKTRITAVDVGTTKVCCIIADAGSRGDVEIIGMGVSPNRGMRRGAVVDVEEVTQAIRSAVGEAEAQAGCNVQRCYVNLSGDFLSNFCSRGSVAISGASKIIAESDVQRVIDNARMVGIPEDRRVLHVIPKGYTVDGLGGIKNPVGLSGLLLQVDTHIIAAAQASLQNINHCLENADLEPEESGGLVVSSVATCLGALQDEEKDLGVALIDIGGGTTDLAVFKDGQLRHTDVLCVGGNLITYDVATALRIPLQEAERLVIEEGLAWKYNDPNKVDLSDDGEVTAERELDVTSLSSVQPQNVKVSELNEIIELRLLDVFEWIKTQLANLARQGTRPASIVLTGGVAQMHGVAAAAEKALNYPVRVARPETLHGLPSHLRSPAYAAGVGLIIYGVGILKGKVAPARSNQAGRALHGLVTWLREYVF